jgi:mono/diheme cytochrome c family protein
VPARLALAASCAGALAALLVGCGGSGSSTPSAKSTAAGQKVFEKANCGTCHTLAAANASGSIGPNLDQLKPTAEAVARQVRAGGNGMPAFKGTLDDTEIAEVAAFVAGSAQASAAAQQAFGAIAADFEPDKTKISSCGDDWRCYEQAFGNLAYYDGARTALARVARAMETNQSVQADCHLIVHAVGAGAYVRYKDAGKAFVDAGPLATTCFSGFYHGVLQRALNGVQAGGLTAAARRLCATPAVKRNYFVLSECVHGLGHGLMIYTGYNLPRALGTCHRLDTEFDQTSCTGGVFMENFQTSVRIRSPWLKTSDPIFPCNAVAARDKDACYLILTAHLLDVTGHDFAKVARLCLRSDKAFVATCFESYGRDVAGATLAKPRKILDLCALTPREMVSRCIYGAARSVTGMDASARRSTPLCNLAPARYRAHCFNGVGSVLGGLHIFGEQRKAECRRSVPRAYWRDCYRGANA